MISIEIEQKSGPIDYPREKTQKPKGTFNRAACVLRHTQ